LFSPSQNDAGSLEVREQIVHGQNGPIPVRHYSSPERLDRRLAPLIWMHGGAFVWGGLNQLESHAVASAIANSGRAVIAVDYHRVAPFNPLGPMRRGVLRGIRFPVPAQDVVDVATETAAANGGRFVLGGASAGACLAAAAALRISTVGGPVPKRLILAYGIFHPRLPPVSVELRARLRPTWVRPVIIERMSHNYAGSVEAMNDPFAFPGGHNLRGLPPALLLDADRDQLRASSEAFATELREQGVAVERRVFPGTDHGFLDAPRRPAFAQAISATIEWLADDSARGISER
jgi:acetyl esterase